MSKLALYGGAREVTGPLLPFRTIGPREESAAVAAVRRGPLSGYLAGERRGGFNVCRLEDEWAARFKVRHAIACNSATSGLLAAAFAIGLKPGDRFLCPSWTMSATAAAPMFTGATPVFGDVHAHSFNVCPDSCDFSVPVNAIFLTHLFGNPIDEGSWTIFAHQNNIKVVVDAAQAPFAKEDGVYAGTIGDINIFSFNVHKPLQSGEGGMVVTNDDDLSDRLRGFINHGECSGSSQIGLNLRMTEVTAAIAFEQLKRAEAIIEHRVQIAQALSEAVRGLPGITPPYAHPDCRHVYYCWAAKLAKDRNEIVRALQCEGVPVRKGYTEPLYRLPAFKVHARPCPVVERLQDHELILYENCAYDPTPDQVKQIGSAFCKVMEHFA